MTKRYEIIIHHEESVSLAALQQITELLMEASRRAAQQLSGSAVVTDFRFTENGRNVFINLLLASSPHAFSLDEVAPGSSIVKGTVGTFVRAVVVSTIAAIGGHAGWDIVKDTEAYQTAKPHIVEATDQFVNLVLEHIRMLAKESSQADDINVEIEFIGDLVRIHVFPNRRLTEIVTVGN